MNRDYEALVFHEGLPPEVTDSGADGSLCVTAEMEASEYTTRSLGADGPLDVDECAADVVLVARDYDWSGRLGLGIEGAFCTRNLPVVAVTTALDRAMSTTVRHTTKTDSFTLPRFDAALSPHALCDSVQLNALFALIDAYGDFAEDTPIATDDIVEALEPPTKYDESSVEEAVPVDISADGTSDVRYVAKWIRHHFLETPGPTVDTPRAATRAGMTVDAFERRASVFSDAKYEGVFSEASGDRWWWKSVEIIAHEEDFDLREDERATCVTCGRHNPDRSAEYEFDAPLTSVKPVHHGCSNIARSRRDPYFDTRIVRPDYERTDTILGSL